MGTKKKLLLCLFLSLSTVIFGQKITVTAIPYDTFLAISDNTLKPILDRMNCPAVFENTRGSIGIMPARNGYYGLAVMNNIKKPSESFFLQLKPVTGEAKAMLNAAGVSTEKILNYLELYPMLADDGFYAAYIKAMENAAAKSAPVKPGKIFGNVIYKNETLGIYAVSEYNSHGRSAQNPMAPGAAGETSSDNDVRVYFFSRDGKLKYLSERVSKRFVSFSAVPDKKGERLKITEEYVTFYMNNLQGDIHVKLEYTVSIPDFKVKFEKATYYTDKNGAVYMPVEYKIKPKP